LKKNKKNEKKITPAEAPYITAESCFCDIEVRGEPYEWVSWGLVIRHLRDFIGMDQELFGRLLQGYNRGQIARYETEQAEPPIDFWIKMMRTFGLNISWALTGHGEPFITEFKESEERKRLDQRIIITGDKAEILRELRGEVTP
jgi:hypothetical protein